jgi:hypothetical protein
VKESARLRFNSGFVRFVSPVEGLSQRVGRKKDFDRKGEIGGRGAPGIAEQLRSAGKETGHKPEKALGSDLAACKLLCMGPVWELEFCCQARKPCGGGGTRESDPAMHPRRDAIGLAMLLADDAREKVAGDGGDMASVPV